MSSDPAKKNRASQMSPLIRKNANPSHPIRLSVVYLRFFSPFVIPEIVKVMQFTVCLDTSIG